MKFTRSTVRHTCFRTKNEQPVSEGCELIVEKVAKIIPKGETWKTFSINWDVFVENDGNIIAIKPEADYDYIHSVCLEASLYKKKKMPFEFDARAQNVIQIVELNMMSNMHWEDYNKTWGVFVDHELKKIHTKWFKTAQNVVTDEMIESSKKSDGSELTSLASIPMVELEMTPSEPTEQEKALINKLRKAPHK